jgi:hypothetical protein
MGKTISRVNTDKQVVDLLTSIDRRVNSLEVGQAKVVTKVNLVMWIFGAAFVGSLTVFGYLIVFWVTHA